MIRFLALTFLLVGCAGAQKQAAEESAGDKRMIPMEQRWNLTEKIDAPESAYFDRESDSIFVSSVAGQPNGKDKKGWISRLDKNGNVQSAEFAKGFNAPKGLRSHKGTLWVTDIDEVVSIDIKSSKIAKRHKVKDAKFLNDVAIADDGTIYVSDMITNKIHKIDGGKVTTFMEGANLESPNGLLVDGGKLIVASWGAEMKPDFSVKTPGHLYSIDLKTKEKKNITTAPLGNLDGLERLPNGHYIVSDWMAGKVFIVTAEGKSGMILEGFKGAADVGWIQETGTLIVPRMGENQVTAFGWTIKK